MDIQSQLKVEIAKKEKELGALKTALAVLGGQTGGKTPGKGNRGPRTEAHRRKIALALKKAWAARKKAAGKQVKAPQVKKAARKMEKPVN